MHRVKKYFSLALFTLLIGSVAAAQTNNPEVMTAQEFFGLLANQPDSSTDWVFILDEAAYGIKMKYRMKLARKQGKVRRETYPLENETRLKNKADTDYKIVEINRMGQPSVALNPQAKTYAEMPGGISMPGFDLEGFIQSKARELNKLKIENVGVENFNGHPAKKIKLSFEGESGVVFMYFANDLKNLLIGIGPDTSEKSLLTISNISFDLPDELFEIPQGYKKVNFNSFQKTLKQKLPPIPPSKYPSGIPNAELRPPIISSDLPMTDHVDSIPLLLNQPKLEYTEEARRNQVQGIITLQITVGADGSVKTAKVLAGLPDGLDEQAIKAALKRKYRPAMKDGKPVSCEMKIALQFKLD